ncbi:MAG: InlB B-repeat-containing protein [Bacilli bacterium]|nr:InlB B-repeat-containing protein [Bacilli bacterium]
MKKGIILLLISLIIGLTGCQKDTIPTLTIEETDYTIGLDESITLVPITTFYQGGFTLSYSDSSIVSTSGLTLTGIKEGTTMVILSLAEDPSLKVYLFIHVVNEDIPYSITYVLNGGAIHINAPTTYKMSHLPLSLPTPTKTGYTFGGWYTASDYSSSALTNLPVTTTGAIKLYAKWN